MVGRDHGERPGGLPGRRASEFPNNFRVQMSHVRILGNSRKCKVLLPGNGPPSVFQSKHLAHFYLVRTLRITTFSSLAMILLPWPTCAFSIF